MEEEEHEVLASYTPIKTLLILMVGPCMCQLVIAANGIVDSFWISKAFGNLGMDVASVTGMLELLVSSFSVFLSETVTFRVSFLFGEKRDGECAQLFVDVIRISILFTAISVAILLPIAKPFSRFLGASDDIGEQVFEFLIPLTTGSIITFLFNICCGLIEAEGRSILFGVYQGLSVVLSMFGFEPLLLMVFKTSIWGASFALILGQTIPTIMLMHMIFSGKCHVKPKFSMFKNPISPELSKAMVYAIPNWVSFVAYSFPMVIYQKVFSKAAASTGEYGTVMAVWTVFIRLQEILVAIPNAAGQGMVPAASYAYGAKNYSRIRSLFLHALWISSLWGVLFTAVMYFFPGPISRIWSKDGRFEYWIKELIPTAFYFAAFIGAQFCGPDLLQTLQKVVPATVLSIFTMVIPIPVLSLIAEKLYPTSPRRMILFVQCFAETIAFTLCLAMSVYFLCRLRPQEDRESTPLLSRGI